MNHDPTHDAAAGDAFFVHELAARDGSGAQLRLQHPFARAPITSWAMARLRLAQAATALAAPVYATRSFTGDGVRARAWQATVDGQPVEGLTVLRRTDDEVEARLLLRPLPLLTPWRDRAFALAAATTHDEGWQVPQVAPERTAPAPEGTLPFALAEDVVFHSPILSKSVRGAGLVAEVMAHATAVYGPRTSGPTLRSNGVVLNLWSVAVAGLTIDAGSLVELDGQGRATSLRVFMAPYPAVRVFQSRMRARAGHLFDASAFGPPGATGD